MGTKSKRELEFDFDGEITNEYFIKFQEEKKQIKSKYNPDLFSYPTAGRERKDSIITYQKNDHIEYRKYIKEISDLMFDTNGNYQKFLWDVIPGYIIKQQEAKVKEKKTRKI